MSEETKRCSGTCGLDLPLSAFALSRTKTGGRQAACRGCQSVYRARYKDRDEWVEAGCPDSTLQHGVSPVQPIKVDENCSVLHEPNAWVGMIDGLLRQPQKNYFWSVR